jgi:transposase-like protein
LCHSLLESASFHRSLAGFDADVAKQTQESGCAICGGRLHRSNYPRKPRGTPAEAESELTAFRTSFCCADRDCRKRSTPPSLLFLDRRVYVSLFVTLAAILVNGVTPRRVREVAQELDVDRRTLEHWRDWWTQQLPKTPFWGVLRGRFDRPVDESTLPASLLERIAGPSDEDRLRRLLDLLRDLSHSALMRARSAMSA